MALLFYDGFDWANNAADLARKWTGVNYGSFGNSYGRFGTNGVSMSSGGSYLTKEITPKTTIYVGAAFRFAISTTGVSYNSGYPFFQFSMDSTVHVRFHFITSTLCRFYTLAGTQIGTDITVPSILNRWMYIEIKVTISDTVGALVLRMNGVEYYNGTNLDTRNGTPTEINSIRLSVINNDYTYLDDIYIDDAQFHGDVRVRTIYPDANGSTNNFTVYPSGSNYQAVDDSGDPDDDTTYNSDSTVGNKDLYGVTAPTLATVKAVAVNNMVRKDDAGTRKIKNVVRSGGTNYLGSEVDVDSVYGVKQSIWETDPADSNAWNKTKIDNAEFGLEITA